MYFIFQILEIFCLFTASNASIFLSKKKTHVIKKQEYKLHFKFFESLDVHF